VSFEARGVARFGCKESPPSGQFGEQIALTRAFAAALDGPRDPDLPEHTFLEVVRSRVYGILADSEDQNDHGTLRTDPVFKLIAGHPPLVLPGAVSVQSSYFVSGPRLCGDTTCGRAERSGDGDAVVVVPRPG
jgi:hypothetical protein